MAISKQVHNSGCSGGHGMQEIDVLKRRMLEDKFQEEKNENKCYCGNGHEFVLIGEIIPRREEALLSMHVRQNNLCPFCHKIDGSINFKFCTDNQNNMGEYAFEMDGKTYNTIYKPSGYKFLPPLESDDE